MLMKKLILLFAVAVAAIITGCDPTTFFYYEIVNETQSSILVKIGEQEPVTIQSGGQTTIYNFSKLGEWDTEPFRGDYITPYIREVEINGNPISDDFWRREYWTYKSESKHQWIYTLVLTNELIETLLSQQNN